MKRYARISILCTLMVMALLSCRSTRKINGSQGRTDPPGGSKIIKDDSITTARELLVSLQGQRLDFRTFSAKIKTDYQDDKGKQPDFNAFVRLQKDSALWVSINASFLNIEAYRVLIKPDSIIILNKLAKEYEKHPFSYLSELTHIPLTFPVLQDLLIGNPIFVGDSIASYQIAGNQILLSTPGDIFKNLLTISADTKLLARSQLEDSNTGSNRTANISYNDYEMADEKKFSMSRRIIITEKSKIEIALDYKQVEFNKELSMPFSVPPNYKLK